MSERAALAMALALAALPGLAAAGDYADIRDKLELCFSCHGPNGASTDPNVPIIAGQHMYYLYTQLKDFAAGRRQNETMGPVVAGIDKEVLKKLATYFSEQKWPTATAPEPDAETAKKAVVVGEAGECGVCHLGGYVGTSGVPRMAGQHEAYLLKTMMDLKSGARGNAAAISSLLRSYSDEDLAAMAKYLASLKSGS